MATPIIMPGAMPGARRALIMAGLASPGPAFLARRPWAVGGLGALGDAAFREAMSAGFSVQRQVGKMRAIQDALWQAIEPGFLTKTFGFNDREITDLRKRVQEWNDGQLAMWWDPKTTTKAVETPDDLRWWIEEGKRTYDDAAQLAAEARATTLLAKIRTARAEFIADVQNSLVQALQAVGTVGRTVVGEGGKIIGTGADAVSGALQKLSFGIAIPIVAILGAVGLGFYLLKRGGVKANVAVPGVPVSVGVGGLRSLHGRRRRRRHHRS